MELNVKGVDKAIGEHKASPYNRLVDGWLNHTNEIVKEVYHKKVLIIGDSHERRV